MSRIRFAGVVTVALLFIGMFALRVGMVVMAEDALADRGFVWDDRSQGLDSTTWHGLKRDGVQARKLRASLLEQQLVVSNVTVDLQELLQTHGGARSVRHGGGAGFPLDARVDGLDVTWGTTPLVGGLSGTLLPLDLENEDGWVSNRNGPLEGRLPFSFGLSHVEAAGIADFRSEGGAVVVSLDLDSVQLQHPVLAAEPLRGDGRATIEYNADLRRVAAFGEIFGLPFDATALEPSSSDVPILGRVGPVGLDTLLDVFDTPEKNRLETQGTLEASFEVNWPSMNWSVVPKVTNLVADNVLPDTDAIQIGPVSWTTPSGDRLRRPPNWVPLRDAGWVDEAVIAIEDSQFENHRGYDLGNVREALDAWALGEERPRGGSTLTQQLAKNLYLSGERTVERKLRELAYALALERAAPKDRLLAIYLNIVEFAPGVYGMGPGAQHYFSKRPDQLDPHEAALLAAVLPSPQTSAGRALHGRLPTVRIAATLDAMVFTGALTRDEAARWKAAPLVVAIDR